MEKKKTGIVLGIISLFAWFIPLAGFPVSIVGIIRSISGMKQDDNKKAMTGLILNIIGLVLTIVNSAIGAYTGAMAAIGYM